MPIFFCALNRMSDRVNEMEQLMVQLGAFIVSVLKLEADFGLHVEGGG